MFLIVFLQLKYQVRVILEELCSFSAFRCEACASSRSVFLSYREFRRNFLYGNEVKHASRVPLVIAAVAKASLRHGLWLVARRTKSASGLQLPHPLTHEGSADGRCAPSAGPVSNFFLSARVRIPAERFCFIGNSEEFPLQLIKCFFV